MIRVFLEHLFTKTAYAAGGVAPITTNVSIEGLFSKIASVFVIPIVAAFSVGYAIYAGILFVTSGGDPEKVKTARNALLWVAVGVIVVTLSFGIVVYINKLFQ